METGIACVNGAAASRRFGLGLIASLSLTLVAFEWRGTSRPSAWAAADALALEGEPGLPPVLIRMPTGVAPKREPPRRTAQRAAILPDRLALDATQGPDEATAGEGPTSGALDTVSSIVTHPPEVIEEAFIPWRKGDERMPCWRGCEELRGAARDACTEARIQRHLDRHFRIPSDGPREEFTVITIEIAADGRAGTVVCRPKPTAQVEQEVKRVVTAMPAFIAGEQNGRAVRVIHQLPLRVSRR